MIRNRILKSALVYVIILHVSSVMRNVDLIADAKVQKRRWMYMNELRLQRLDYLLVVD